MPLLPLAGFVVLAGAGRRCADPGQGGASTATGARIAFGWRGSCTPALLQRAETATRSPRTCSLVRRFGHAQVACQRSSTPSSMTIGPLRHGCEMRAHSPLALDRVHARRPRLPEVLRLPEPLRGVDAPPRPRQQPPVHLRGVGGRGGVLVLAGVVLVRARQRRQRGQEGLPLQPARRRGFSDRHLPRLLEDGNAHLHRHLLAPVRHRRRHGHGGVSPAVRRRRRQVGPAPPVPVAGRRHGRPHPGVGPHPRRHHGDRRRLPDVPHQPDPRSQLAHGANWWWHRWGPPRRSSGGDDRHAPTARDISARCSPTTRCVAAGLHVPGRRHGRLRGGHLSHGGARLLQGASLPRGGFGHPLSRRRTGPQEDGEPAPLPAHHHCHLRRGMDRHCRHPTPVGLLRQG